MLYEQGVYEEDISVMEWMIEYRSRYKQEQEKKSE